MKDYLTSSKYEKTGQGIFYFNNPHQLLDRLELLGGSILAGNNGVIPEFSQLLLNKNSASVSPSFSEKLQKPYVNVLFSVREKQTLIFCALPFGIVWRHKVLAVKSLTNSVPRALLSSSPKKFRLIIYSPCRVYVWFDRYYYITSLGYSLRSKMIDLHVF